MSMVIMQILKRLPATLLLFFLGVLLIPAIGLNAEEREGEENRADEPAFDEAAPADGFPFSVGEKLTYSIRWGIIRAGSAVLEVHPMMEIDGEDVHHFSLTVRTTGFVDTFYKVRDRIDGFARSDFQGSLLYLLKKEEGKNLRDVRVVYDRDSGTAQYSNFGDKEDPVEIPPATLDPLSVVFAIRAQELQKGTDIELPISDGKRASMGVGHVRGTKRIRVPAGTFEATLLEPDMRDVGGVFDKSGDDLMKIWVSTDERRMPVRISSRVTVGSFHADLVSIEQTETAASADVVDARDKGE